MYFLLIIIILLLVYIAFFTSEKRRVREVRGVQEIFNTKVAEPPLFKIDDPRNESSPAEWVTYESSGRRVVLSRKIAVIAYKTEQGLPLV